MAVKMKKKRRIGRKRKRRRRRRRALIREIEAKVSCVVCGMRHIGADIRHRTGQQEQAGAEAREAGAGMRAQPTANP